MKAEHRKELQTNQLADWLGRTVESAKHGNRSWTVGAAIALGVLALFGIYFYFLGNSSSATTAWAQLSTAQANIDALDKIGAENANQVGRAARFEVSRLLYSEGIRDLANPDTRASAIAKLERARANYEKLAEECKKDAPILEQEALMWTARAEEALMGAVNPEKPGEPAGNIDKAIEYYEKLGALTPPTFQTKAAAARAKVLKDQRQTILDFYAKLNAAAGKVVKK